MTDRSKQSIIVALLAALLCLSAAAQPQTITGKVVSVSDGDTITMLDASKRQHKVRLDGIDAPESNQDFGSRAKQSLSDASALLNAGVPLKMISERLGHSSISITADVYSVVEERGQREASERLEQLFGIGKK